MVEAGTESSLAGLSALRDSLMACDDSAREACAAATLVLGGVSSSTGLVDALTERLQRSDGSGSALPIGVEAHLLPVPTDETRSSAWIGGSILACMGTMPDLWLTRRQWAEEGPRALDRLLTT